MAIGKTNSSGKQATLSDIGLTVSADEINKLDGVTGNIQDQLDNKSEDGHTHNYAGSSSAGGAANSANKLNTNAGSATQPVYFENGVPKATTHSLEADVPADAKFTDTVYTHPTSSGNKHIPSGGASGQILKWTSDGTAVWGEDKDTVYEHPTHTAKDNGLYKVTVDGLGHVSGAEAATKDDILNLGITEGIPLITTAGTGAAYTATVDGVTELYAGLILILNIHTVSTTTTPTLNVNGLGAKNLRQPLTSNSTSTAAAESASWLTANKPVVVMYDGTMWKTISIPKPSLVNAYGILPAEKGGTGLDTLTAGSYLVGNDTDDVQLKTPAEVFTDIGLSSEEWTFTLEDDTTVTKTVVLK